MSQQFKSGNIVKIGFMELKVRQALIMASGPDTYLLTNIRGDKLYQFTPYEGVKAISIEQAKVLMEMSRQYVARVAVSIAATEATVNAVNSVFS